MTERVLFVDDDLSITRAFESFFHEEAFEVETAHSGPEALSILATRDVDVVLSDHQMPGMTGIELLVEVRARYPDATRIMLTGYATLETVLAAINRAEVARFLLKPCSFSDLRRVIREALTRKQTGQEAHLLLNIVKTQARLLDQVEAEFPLVLPKLAATEQSDSGKPEPSGEPVTEAIRHEIARFEERRARLRVDKQLRT